MVMLSMWLDEPREPFRDPWSSERALNDSLARQQFAVLGMQQSAGHGSVRRMGRLVEPKVKTVAR